MHMHIGLLKEIIQDIMGKAIALEEKILKLDREIGVMGNAINIIESKFDVYTDSIGSDLKKLASTI